MGQEDQFDHELVAYLQSIHTQEDRLLSDYTQRTRTLEQEIADRWGQAFARFDLLIIMVQRALLLTDTVSYPAAAASKDFSYEALHALAVRACQTAKEVRALMAKGYAPAANTRWRTLHEIHVVARLIQMHGSPLAERYLQHNIVEKNKLANAAETVFASIGHPLSPEMVEAIANVRAEHDKLKALYASEPAFFRGDYGWAAGFVGKQQRLVDLEEAAGLDDRRYVYRMVSDSIHPNIAGAFAGSQHTSEGELFAIGPSAHGMGPLGQTTAISLVEITRIFLQQALHYDSQQPDMKRELVLMIPAFNALLADVNQAFQADQER